MKSQILVILGIVSVIAIVGCTSQTGQTISNDYDGQQIYQHTETQTQKLPEPKTSATLIIDRVPIQLANLYPVRVTVTNTGETTIDPKFDMYVYKGNDEVCSGSSMFDDFDEIKPREKKTGELTLVGCMLDEDGSYYIKIDLLDSDYNKLDTKMKTFEVDYWNKFMI